MAARRWPQRSGGIDQKSYWTMNRTERGASQASGIRYVRVGALIGLAALSSPCSFIATGLLAFSRKVSTFPIADNRSHKGGRIESKGVQPDIAVPADLALARALSLATKSGS